MFALGDTVLYGIEGVCRIAEIANKNFGGETQEYYVLKPIHQDGSTFYLPLGNPVACSKLRRVLSADEIHDLIRTMPEEAPEWIDDENTRKFAYKEIIQSGDRKELIRMIKALYFHRESLREEGKKFHICDERFMKEAEKVLYDEFAHVLNMEPEEVLGFIMEQVPAE